MVRAVRRRIAVEQLPAGHRIGTKGQLGREFGVSPATLGEALRVLRGQGILDVRPGPGGGVFVADQPPLFRLAQTVLELREDGATVNDVAAVLDGLDDVVLRDAAAYRTAADLRDLDRLVRRLEEAWSDSVARPAAIWALHRRLAEITPNLVLRAFYTNLVAYIGSALDVPEAVVGLDSSSTARLQVHLDLVEAVRTRDDAALTDAVRRHREG